RASIEQRRVYLDAQLAQLHQTRNVAGPEGSTMQSPAERLRSLESFLSNVRGIYKPDHPDVVRAERTVAALREELGVSGDQPADLDREIDLLRAQRAELLEHYSEEHPDVVRLDRQTAALTEKRDKLAAHPADAAKTDSLSDSPAYVQLAAQRESE